MKEQTNFTHFQYIGMILLCLIPLGYFIDGGGMFPLHSTSVVYLLSYIYILFAIYKKKLIPICKVDFYFFLIFFLMGISVFYSPMIEKGFYKLLYFIIMIIPLLFLPRLIIKNKKDLLRIIKIYIKISSLIQFTVLIDFIKKGMPLGRYYFAAVHPIPLAMLSIIVILLVIYLFFVESEKKINLFVPFFLSIIIVIISSSKGPLLSLLFGSLFFLPIIFNRRNFKKVIIFIAILILSFVIICRSDYSSYLDNYIERFKEIQSDGSTYERIYQYQLSIELIKDNFIFGQGLDSYSAFDNHGNTYPHNIIFEVLIDGGILLLIPFIMVFIYVFNRYLKSVVFSKDLNILFLTILVFIQIIALLVSWTYSENKFLFFSIGLLLAYTINENIKTIDSSK